MASVIVIVLISLFCQSETPFAGPVEAEAGKDDAHGGHAPPPPELSVGGTRAGFVGTHDAPIPLMVLAAVVEDCFDTAEAGGVVHEGLRSTVNALGADPAGWKGSRC